MAQDALAYKEVGLDRRASRAVSFACVGANLLESIVHSAVFRSVFRRRRLRLSSWSGIMEQPRPKGHCACGRLTWIARVGPSVTDGWYTERMEHYLVGGHSRVSSSLSSLGLEDQSESLRRAREARTTCITASFIFLRLQCFCILGAAVSRLQNHSRRRSRCAYP